MGFSTMASLRSRVAVEIMGTQNGTALCSVGHYWVGIVGCGLGVGVGGAAAAAACCGLFCHGFL